MDEKFCILYNGHEKGARQLIIERGITSDKELALMSGDEVEEVINNHYAAIKTDDEDYLLVPKDKMEEFNNIITWIK